jgi:hypothetical protein
MVAFTKRRFDQPDDVLRYPRATLDVLRMNGSIWWRMTLKPDWRYSESMRSVEGTDSCPGEHLFMLMLAGRLAVRMKAETEGEFGHRSARCRFRRAGRRRPLPRHAALLR